MSESKLESAKTACKRLNVSTQTLYAYVSRGLIRSTVDATDSRKRQYSSIDVTHLIERQNKGRSRKSVAQSTIDFGEPVLQSNVSSIAKGQFYYHGQNAVELSRKMTLEAVFELLCNIRISSSVDADKQVYISQQARPLDRFIDSFSKEAIRNKSQGNKNHALRLLKLMASNAAQQPPNGRLIHQQLAEAWSSDPRAADLIRRALVLSADHELNASTYAARITASAGATLPACLLTGISTLSGVEHGGITDRCLAWMSKMSESDIADIEISKQSPPPGFGHRLYPDGDPRSIEILHNCPPPSSWTNLCKQVVAISGYHPTLDYGLATLEHQLKLPKGSGFSIFAVGRTVGWLAHCFEQRRDGRLIRPRASE